MSFARYRNSLYLAYLFRSSGPMKPRRFPDHLSEKIYIFDVFCTLLVKTQMFKPKNKAKTLSSRTKT